MSVQRPGRPGRPAEERSQRGAAATPASPASLPAGRGRDPGFIRHPVRLRVSALPALPACVLINVRQGPACPRHPPTHPTHPHEQIVAEELALLAPAEQHSPHEEQQDAEGSPAPAPAQRAQHQHQQGPRFTPSAAHSCSLYEEQGMQLSEVAAERLIKLSTVIEHLVAGGEAAGWVQWNLGWCGLSLWLGSTVPH